MGKLKLSFAFLTLVYIVSPIVFRYSPFIQRSLLFMNHVNTQYSFNLSRPEELGIKCSRLLTLKYSEIVGSSIQNIELGAWHILPESRLSDCVSNPDDNRTYIDDDLAFKDSRPIVLYIHGNGGNRAGGHRGQLYRRLSNEHDYHIITFDYRGYGDSTYLNPTANGLTADADFMYNWLLKQPNVTKNRVIVWGHSLGTAVAVRMVADLPDSNEPASLVLEAPFDTVANAVSNHPFSIPFRVIPYFEYFFTEPIEKSIELNFNSVEKIVKITKTPIVILHAEDDGIIPLKLGENLYTEASKVLGKSRVKFIKISGTHGLGHKHICNHDESMRKVKQHIGEL